MTIFLATLVGTVSRFLLLEVDYRQYPSYPQGYLVHLALGAIAAFLGAVAIPALVNEDYTAATFLALAAQQFREVRNIERESLTRLEGSELVRRGTAYIEGIAKVFEARNYIAMLTAFLTSGVLFLLETPAWLEVLIAVGLSALLVSYLDRTLRGVRVGQYAQVEPAELHFIGPDLYVGDIQIMNVGGPTAREMILKHGLGAILIPKDINSRVTLAHIGQRQAIVHDVATILGIRKEVDEPEFTPMAKIDHETGRIGVYTMPVNKDSGALVTAIKHVPLLESAKKRPSAAISGRLAARRHD
ncbi:MAG: YIEGIA domain-containing protein [Firmicutes bacterium]|nr:YIEGIA domain-containing protein [Bacillota bacterium]